MSQEFDRSLFKDKTVIFCVVHYNVECVKVTLKNILSIIDQNPDVYMVLIDSKSEPNVKALFDAIDHPQVDKISLPLNFGYNASINYYVQDHINDANLPAVIVSLGADILFNNNDFKAMIQAIKHNPKFGVIGLSWADNDCNPERNTFFAPKAFKGTDQKVYHIKQPFMVPVAGGIMGFRGELLKELDFEPFPLKHLPKKFLKTLPVGGADSALYNALKRKYKMGYLANTTAYHLKSRDNKVLDMPKEYNHLLDD